MNPCRKCSKDFECGMPKQWRIDCVVEIGNKCTECGGDATIAMTAWQDNTGKQYIKKGERLCMKCHKARTGIKLKFF